MNQAIPHDSAKLHVTGEARYVDDIPLPAKTLHLAFGLSTIANGEIKSIDLSAVRAAPGVLDIILSKDLPFTNDVAPNAHDEQLLADTHVNFIGQPIFIVGRKSSYSSALCFNFSYH
jgi:xanthine dehydrogenase large subunit